MIPISTASACALSIGNKVLYEIIIIKYNKHKKQYEKDQLTIKLFDKFYRKSLQDNRIGKSEYESLYSFFTEDVDENKGESFLLNKNIKIKVNLFSSNKLKFQPGTL